MVESFSQGMICVLQRKRKRIISGMLLCDVSSLRCDDAFPGNWFLIFQDDLVLSSLRVKISKEKLAGYYAVGNARLYDK
jgi:hypothetical protein